MLQTGVSFARGSYWIEPIRPSVHLTGCDFEYLGAERVAGSSLPSLFVGILLAGEHTGFVDGHSIATTRVGVPMLLGVSEQVNIRSAQRLSRSMLFKKYSNYNMLYEWLFKDSAGLPRSGWLCRRRVMIWGRR